MNLSPTTDASVPPIRMHDPGCGEDASNIQRAIRDLLAHTYQETALGARLSEAISELDEVAEQARRPNWDGYGAFPAREEALREARVLIRALPPELPLPEPSVEPSGAINLEWWVGPRRTYIISFSGRGEVEYAGLFGSSETHGKEPFVGALPKQVRDHLRRLFPEA